MSKSGDEFEFSLGRLMVMAVKAFTRRLEQYLAESGLKLTAGHVVLLKHIGEADGVSQQELAEHLFLEKATVTRLIDALEARNLAVRVQDRADRRQNMVYITPDGKKMIARLHPIALKTEQEAIRGVEMEKVIICKEVLQQVRKNLLK